MKTVVLMVVGFCAVLPFDFGHGQSLPAIRNDPEELSWLLGGAGAWTFYVTSPISVTGVGFYDYGRDGLLDEYHVGIWRDTSGKTEWPFMDPYTATLVSITTVPAGTNADLVGSWRKVDFDVALTLEPGGYEIATTNVVGADWGKFLAIGFNTPVLDPRIELGAPAGGNSHMPPDGYVTTVGAPLGPVFFIEVPEPSPGVLALLGAVLILGRWRPWA